MSTNESAPATELVTTEPGGDVALPTLVISRPLRVRLGDWLASWGTGPSMFSVAALAMSMSFIVVGNLLLFQPRGWRLGDLDVIWQYFLPPAALMAVYGFFYCLFARSAKFQRCAVSARFVISL